MKLSGLIGCMLLYITTIVSDINAQQSKDLNQTEKPEIGLYRPSRESAIILYEKEMNKEFGYVNGHEYKPYFIQNQNSPYFMTAQGLGTIFCNGRAFQNNYIYYDLNLDELILIPTKAELPKCLIQLNKSCIDSFDIEFNKGKFRLINIQFEQDSIGEIKPGFYEIPYKGKYQYFIKHRVISSKSNENITYDYKKEKFLVMDGVFYNITSKKAFLHLFEQNRKILKKKINQFALTYKDLNNSQMISLIQFVETH